MAQPSQQYCSGYHLLCSTTEKVTGGTVSLESLTIFLLILDLSYTGKAP